MRYLPLLILAAVGRPIAAAETDAPPIPEIRHEPTRPKPGDTVLVTARLAPGTTRAVLKLQAVAPGKYVRKSDPAYEADWRELPMRDDGKEGDAEAGDGTFTVRVPAEYQRSRWLLRYRIAATDRDGKVVPLPEPEGDVPNYAWWCDAGPAAWTGSRDPGKAPAEVYSGAFLGTLQSLTLLARAEDVAKSQWDGNFYKKKQAGTIVYRGTVYDHIQFRNRGQGSTYISGKNKWGLKFNDGQELPFADHEGKPFPAPCSSLDLNPGGCTPYLPVHRGISGLDEVLSMRAYRLAGVPSPPATWVQWRVVAGAEEVSPKDQFAGDLWGLYVALGPMTPKLLADKRLPNGLTVSTQSGIKYAPKNMAEPQKVWDKFLADMRANPREAWWRANLDLPAYFSFHALNRLLGNVDLRPDGNHGYYRHPDGHWAPIPWDNDMMFVPRHHQPGTIEAVGCLKHPAIAREFRNRGREILDLFAADGGERGGQVGQFAADLGAALTPRGFAVDWPRLDAALWNQNPHSNQKGAYFVNPAAAEHFGGPWKRTLATADFAGFRRYVVDFCTDSRPAKNYAPNDGDPRGYGWGYLAYETRDDTVPATPAVQRPNGTAFQFRASAFASPSGDKPAALEWRVGRFGHNGLYELTEHWRKAVEAGTEMEMPPEVFKESGEYRVRARWRDQTGRCGHWSPPVVVAVR